jgi:hypothetical protein
MRVLSFLSVLLFSFEAHAGCDLSRCYARQDAGIQARVLGGELVSFSEAVSGSPFEVQYAMKLIRGATPELVAGTFVSFENHSRQLPSLADSTILRTEGNSVTVRYELDVSRVIGGAMGLLSKAAPNSKYAVTNTVTHQAEPAAILVRWTIDKAATDALYPDGGKKSWNPLKKAANMTKPAHIEGFLLIEPVPGTSDSVITQANYVLPESEAARGMADTLNRQAVTVLNDTVARMAAWIESVAVGPAETQERYRRRLCALILTK